jgi:signal transduction histidine kinase
VRLAADVKRSTPDGGTVRIETLNGISAEGKPMARVTIRDTRKTVRQDAGERVFDPYYQSGSGKTNPGFSLALVYHFVALSGGTIHVESAPGEGSAYCLSFPAVENLTASEPLEQELAVTA